MGCLFSGPSISQFQPSTLAGTTSKRDESETTNTATGLSPQTITQPTYHTSHATVVLGPAILHPDSRSSSMKYRSAKCASARAKRIARANPHTQQKNSDISRIIVTVAACASHESQPDP